jgi:hypothetical protein
MAPEHYRSAGIAKAEKALRELTDAADQLGIADKATRLLVCLWDLFHPGRLPPLVRHKAPILDKPNLTPTIWRGARCNLRRIDSTEGRAALQDVLLGLLSHREAARKLGAHPNAVCDAVRRLRQEGQQPPAAPPANDAAEIALTCSLKSH